MMRLLRHYISQALLTLLGVEALSLFGSIYLGRALYFMAIQGEDGFFVGEMIPSASAFMFVMLTIMIALGLYERNFWSGKGEMLLRVGVSFLFGLFVMTLLFYLVPDLALGRGEFSFAIGIAFLSVLSLRFIFFKITRHDQLKQRVLVLGVGDHAAEIEALQQQGTMGFLVPGYIQVHEHETPRVPAGRMLQVTSNLANLETTRTPEGGPYRRKEVIINALPVDNEFASVLNNQVGDDLREVVVTGVIEDQSEPTLVYNPDHPDADERGYVKMPNVNMVKEMVDLINASRSFEANVQSINAAKAMAQRAIELGR